MFSLTLRQEPAPDPTEYTASYSSHSNSGKELTLMKQAKTNQSRIAPAVELDCDQQNTSLEEHVDPLYSQKSKKLDLEISTASLGKRRRPEAAREL